MSQAVQIFTYSIFRDCCLVGLLADGPFRERLEQHQIPAQVLTKQVIKVSKKSGLIQAVKSIKTITYPINQATQKASEYDLIYANTQKALVVGAIASFFSRRPLIYHLHDIVSSAHFSFVNRQLITALANCFVTHVIANSKATQLGGAENF